MKQSRRSAPTRTPRGRASKTKTEARRAPAATQKAKARPGPRLLAGGNPQIAKADGQAPVQAYLAAIPDWKRDLARTVDAIITRTVPTVRKAVRWNSPFYGIAGQGWFLSMHCFTKYLKVAFFAGKSLEPLPPGASKLPNVRYLDIREHDGLDEARFERWVLQASRLPGWGNC